MIVFLLSHIIVESWKTAHSQRKTDMWSWVLVLLYTHYTAKVPIQGRMTNPDMKGETSRTIRDTTRKTTWHHPLGFLFPSFLFPPFNLAPQKKTITEDSSIHDAEWSEWNQTRMVYPKFLGILCSGTTFFFFLLLLLSNMVREGFRCSYKVGPYSLQVAL